MEAAWVGVGLAFALEFCNFMKHMVRMMAQSEVQLNALERTKEYTDDLDSEAPDVLPRPTGWPADNSTNASAPAPAPSLLSVIVVMTHF